MVSKRFLLSLFSAFHHLKNGTHHRITLYSQSFVALTYLFTNLAFLLVFAEDEGAVNTTTGPSPPPVPPALVVETSAVAARQSREVQSAITKAMLNDNVTKAEILWSLHCVCDHTSQRSAARSVSLFPNMFPYSDTACKMELQWTKVGYYINHGLGPHFSGELRKYLEDTADFVSVGFDESLNKITQKIQMDLQVRFWHKEKDECVTRYLTSEFLGHATAVDLRTKFESEVGEKLLQKLLQVSMDGPHVNWLILDELIARLKKLYPQAPILLQIGSCGLHVIHGAFKTGFKETGWGVIQFLRALYYLFKDVPARRADLAHYSKQDLVPLKFCEVRWLESASVANRAILLLPGLQKFLDAIEKKKPLSSSSYLTVKNGLSDPMLRVKLAFFVSVCSLTENFLREFQSDAPYVPFLYEALQDLVRSLMEMFVNEEVLSESPSVTSVDITDDKNLPTAIQVKLSYTVKDAILQVRKDVKSKDILLFRQDCRTALISMTKKILERSPLKYKFTCAASCLDPAVLSTIPDVCLKRLSKCL